MIRLPFLYLAIGIIILLASSYGVSIRDPITMFVYGLPAGLVGIVYGIFQSRLVQRKVEKTGVWISSKKSFLILPAAIVLYITALVLGGSYVDPLLEFILLNGILFPIAFLLLGVSTLTEAILYWNWESRNHAKMFFGSHSPWRSRIIAVPKTRVGTTKEA